jgi:hypothetical protein
MFHRLLAPLAAAQTFYNHVPGAVARSSSSPLSMSYTDDVRLQSGGLGSGQSRVLSSIDSSSRSPLQIHRNSRSLRPVSLAGTLMEDQGLMSTAQT